MENLSVGYNQEKIQNMNRTLVLNLLRKEGICSRVHLAQLSQLKQATITNMVSDFIDWGLVKEVGFLTGNKGRRSIGISINNNDFGILAIRLARKNYSIGIFDLSSKSIKLKQIDINPSQAPEITIEKIIQDGKKLIEDSKDRKIIAIGMAIPGPYSLKKGRIEIMTGVAGWNKIPIRQLFEETFNIPLFIEQDANAGAMAQYWHNDEQFKNEMLVYIAVGQGVGAGIINNGEIIRGAIGMAGEIGHTSINFNGPQCACGNYGCLEGYCSSIAFTNSVNKVLHADGQISFSDASALLISGNPLVKEEFVKVCDMLSIGIINVINSFNPSIIVIGDDMSHICPDLMLQVITDNVKKRLLPSIYEDVKITMSLVSTDSIAHGAAIIAIKKIFANPEGYFSKD